MPEFNPLANYNQGLQVANNQREVFNALDNDRKKALYTDVRQGLSLLNSGNDEGFINFSEDRIRNIERLGGDPSDTIGLLDMYQSGDTQGVMSALQAEEQSGIDQGFLSDPLDRELKKANITAKKASAGGSANIRGFNSLVSAAEADPEGETITGKAALIELGLIAKVSNTAAERIAQNEILASKVAKVEGDKATAKETAKLKAQFIHKPQIASAVKLAEKQATERGDVLTSLERSQAALPGLNVAVAELKELAKISTSTFGGRLFDTAVKETGFGSSKGGTARAKFIAIVNNQVLPLLKETFGAAFTFQEGESLKATMGDPNSSPQEKSAQLDAFIAQKVRDIETKQRQLSPGAEVSAPQLSDVDLLNKYGG
jgi:hypothetical protein